MATQTNYLSITAVITAPAAQIYSRLIVSFPCVVRTSLGSCLVFCPGSYTRSIVRSTTASAAVALELICVIPLIFYSVQGRSLILGYVSADVGRLPDEVTQILTAEDY